MKEINWHTGNPIKSGLYLTTRKSKIHKNKPYVFINLWKGLDCPNNKNPHWEIGVLDDSETIAWASMNDIEPYNK